MNILGRWKIGLVLAGLAAALYMAFATKPVPTPIAKIDATSNVTPELSSGAQVQAKVEAVPGLKPAQQLTQLAEPAPAAVQAPVLAPGLAPGLAGVDSLDSPASVLDLKFA